MTARRLPTFLALALLLSCTAPPASASGPTVLSVEAWREDLRALAEALSTRHREPFRKVSRGDFERAVAELGTRIPTLADHEIVAGFARLAAKLGDGHTRLTLPEGDGPRIDRSHSPTAAPASDRLAFRRLPVRLGLFPEGLFVTAAMAAHRDLIGARVLRVGRMDAAAAVEAV